MYVCFYTWVSLYKHKHYQNCDNFGGDIYLPI